MCSTCNHKNYTPVLIQSGNTQISKLELSIGMGSLVIQCDPNGKNYWLSIQNDPKSSFRMYRCPTCGNKLY